MVNKKSRRILHSKKNHKKKTRIINKKFINNAKKKKNTRRVKRKMSKKINKKTKKLYLNNIIGGKAATGIFTRKQEFKSPFKDNLMNKFKDLIKVKMQELKYSSNSISTILDKLNKIDLNNKKESDKIFNKITIEDNNKKPKKLNNFLENIYLKILYYKNETDTNVLYLYVTLLFIKKNLQRIRRDILQNFINNSKLIDKQLYDKKKTKFGKYSFLKRSLTNPANLRRLIL